MFKTYERIVFCFIILCISIIVSNHGVVDGKSREVSCPEYCICDIFETLRRATCEYKMLVSIEIDMPPQAQVLNLAHNQIAKLGKNIFLEIGLTNLLLLNLSHNAIGEIHLNGFEGLKELKTLDLSFNHLRYLLEQWYVSLSSLEELYLRGNILTTINSQPHLNFINLRVLDISLCAIETLKSHLFHKLPNLEQLDVSENYLTHLKIDVIKELKHLDTLIVHGNTFKCGDKKLFYLLNYANTRGIRYIDPCRQNVAEKLNTKFERMMLAPDEPTKPQMNGWLYDPNEEKDIEIRIIEKCSSANKNIYDMEAVNLYDRYLMEVITLSPVLFTMFALIFGISLGILLGCTCQLRGERLNAREPSLEDINLPTVAPPSYGIDTTPEPTNLSANPVMQQHLDWQNNISSNYNRPRTKSTGSRKLVREDRNLLLMNESNLADSTPVLTRKYPR